MPPLDAESLGTIVATAIKTALAPFVARLTALEGKAAVLPRDGRDGAPGPPGPAADTDVVMSRLALVLSAKALAAGFGTPAPVAATPDVRKKTIKYERIDGQMRPVEVAEVSE